MSTIDAITNGEMSAMIGGKKRTLKMGMLTFKLLENEPGMGSFNEIGATLWAALMVRQSVNDLPADFSVDTALEWIDEMSDDDLVTLLALKEKTLSRLKNVSGRVQNALGRDENGVPLPIGKTSKSPATK